MLLNACGEPEKKKNPTETKGRVLEYSNTLSFLNADGEVVSTLRFVKADDEAERNQGLMDVNSMPSDAGMVFTLILKSLRASI